MFFQEKIFFIQFFQINEIEKFEGSSTSSNNSCVSSSSSTSSFTLQPFENIDEDIPIEKNIFHENKNEKKENKLINGTIKQQKGVEIYLNF